MKKKETLEIRQLNVATALLQQQAEKITNLSNEIQKTSKAYMYYVGLNIDSKSMKDRIDGLYDELNEEGKIFHNMRFNLLNKYRSLLGLDEFKVDISDDNIDKEFEFLGKALTILM